MCLILVKIYHVLRKAFRKYQGDPWSQTRARTLTESPVSVPFTGLGRQSLIGFVSAASMLLPCRGIQEGRDKA